MTKLRGLEDTVLISGRAGIPPHTRLNLSQS